MKSVCNLLPERLQHRQIIRRSATRWAALLLACGLFAGVTYARRWQSTRALREDVEAAEADVADIHAAVRDGDLTQARIRELQQRRRKYRSLTNTHTPLSLLHVVGQSARRTAGQVRLESIAVRESAPTAALAGRVTIELEGTARSDRAIGLFVAELRNSRVFTSVDLKSTRGTQGAKQTLRQFRLECILFPSHGQLAGRT